MSDRWRPNFDSEFRQEIEKFLDRHDEIPYSDPREFVEAVVKAEIMDIETKQKNLEERARDKIKDDLGLD